jgi:hypothetical protein
MYSYRRDTEDLGRGSEEGSEIFRYLWLVADVLQLKTFWAEVRNKPNVTATAHNAIYPMSHGHGSHRNKPDVTRPRITKQ